MAGHYFPRTYNSGLQSRGRNCHRMLNKLPDNEDRAENENRVSDCFSSAAASFFRTDKQSVCGFLVIYS